MCLHPDCKWIPDLVASRVTIACFSWGLLDISRLILHVWYCNEIGYMGNGNLELERADLKMQSDSKCPGINFHSSREKSVLKYTSYESRERGRARYPCDLSLQTGNTFFTWITFSYGILKGAVQHHSIETFHRELGQVTYLGNLETWSIWKSSSYMEIDSKASGGSEIPTSMKSSRVPRPGHIIFGLGFMGVCIRCSTVR